MVRYPAAWLAAAAVFLLLPSLLMGTLPSHSSPQNLTWAAQFADQFRAGILYPRSLPDSFDGLGGPAFYFYPPITFWVDALLSVVTFDAFSVSHRLSFSSLILLWSSGLFMHAWLKDETASPWAAVCGALVYMTAPYHLLDHYYRGAFAEFAAYAVLPFLALAVRRTAEGQRFGPVLLALAYAALPMSHLPTSLLISLTALPLYVLFRGWRLGTARAAAGFFVRCIAGGSLGLGLAAIYLVPALTLQGWIPADTFWSDNYRIENWFLLTPGRWPPAIDMMWIIVSFAVGYGLAALGLLAVLVQRSVSRGWRTEAAFWAAVCLLCLLIVAGVLPWFWQFPFVAKVQFPWRLMIVVEFAGITALCLAPWADRRRALLLIIAALPGARAMVEGIQVRMALSHTQEDPADLKQFLPAGYPMKPNGGYANLGLEPLQGVPVIACAPRPRTCRATGEPFGALHVEIDGDAPTTVILRRFAFPYWQLEPVLPLVATEPLRLVSFVVPPGRHVYRLQHKAVAAERTGWAISGLSLAVLLAWALRANSRQPRDRVRLHAHP